MRILGACLAGLIVAGCVSDDEVEQALHDVFAPIATLFEEQIREHPAALKAYLDLECNDPAVCKDGKAVATECRSDRDAWDTAFGDAFATCALTCKDGPTCFSEALSAEKPDKEDSAEVAACRAALGRCQDVRTDACDALSVLTDDLTVSAIGACNDSPCYDLADCYRDALLPDGIDSGS
jgi:hypothetical protein